MPVENIMYFVLGLLCAGLLAVMIVPAIWRRAVRLTKKRIEAATPMTMAEFRADKDQLRAEFALSTRRLEMNVETLRKRLSEQLNDINSKRTDLNALKVERDNHMAVVRELEAREAEARRRVLELEKEGADLAQRLRMRDREFASKIVELESAREALRGKLPKGVDLDGKALSGDYDRDIDELMTALAIERKRAGFLEDQARRLIAQMESSDKRSALANGALAELRAALAAKDDAATAANTELLVAEARIANAEGQLNALLEETRDAVEGTGSARTQMLLAEKLSLEEQVAKLKEQVLSVEGTVMADWDTERISLSHMRERLNDIASNVSRLVYAVDGTTTADAEESLFDRVQRFADDGLVQETIPVKPGRPLPKPANKGAVSDRMAALRDLQR